MYYGADPEFFVAYQKGGKDYVASPALLVRDLGMKVLEEDDEHPLLFTDGTNNFVMDGVAIEDNLARPFEDPMEMAGEIKNGLERLGNFISGWKHPDLGDLYLCTKPFINVDLDYYKPRLGDNLIFEGFRFGCSPDEDVTIPDYVCPTIDATKIPFRYGGGHLHFSGDRMIEEFPIPFLKLLIPTLALFMVKETPYPDLERKRNQYYGMPGRYRLKVYSKGEHGVEYRSPSNTWVQFTEDKLHGLFGMAERALQYLKEEKTEVLDNFLEPACSAVTNYDQPLARELLAGLP